MNYPSRGHYYVNFLKNSSPPNVSIGGPVRVSPGFPLKACGNDVLLMPRPGAAPSTLCLEFTCRRHHGFSEEPHRLQCFVLGEATRSDVQHELFRMDGIHVKLYLLDAVLRR